MTRKMASIAATMIRAIVGFLTVVFATLKDDINIVLIVNYFVNF